MFCMMHAGFASEQRSKLHITERKTMLEATMHASAAWIQTVWNIGVRNLPVQAIQHSWAMWSTNTQNTVDVSSLAEAACFKEFMYRSAYQVACNDTMTKPSSLRGYGDWSDSAGALQSV